MCTACLWSGLYVCNVGKYVAGFMVNLEGNVRKSLRKNIGFQIKVYVNKRVYAVLYDFRMNDIKMKNVCTDRDFWTVYRILIF